MNLIERFLEKAKSLDRRIVFPEGNDERIVEAAAFIEKEKIGHPILLGNKQKIHEHLLKLNLSPDNISIIEPKSSPYFHELTELYAARRKNVSMAIAERLLCRELIFGGMLISANKADCLVAGASNTTANVIQSAALTIGYQDDVSTASSFFIMVLPENKILFYADCAVNIDPDVKQLSEIGITTARSFKKLIGEEPKVAFLSFSTKGSANHPLVDKVTQAVQLAKSKDPTIDLDGEFQADTALVKQVAEKKLKESGSVAGIANILIFPDLNSGNIAYKLTQYLAKAEAYGPVLQGFRCPVSDLSRGAKVKDIVGVSAITSLQV
ncbi:MAG: phosphate acetyltransferase [Candidatus Omnitrophica bacterium]|nr:phosphate acetyltransferase [Candidatus Omnitrophota bacterium]